ncbi:MAG: orotidine-5'-phosphate decarboxylase, partial [Eggerthellaceae bacterium]|nr:orotidine-5'-phosphate decarboxylase [Eggerthellaceae bacterium]
DLKLHDITHQVEEATNSVIATGADMFTCHASGGLNMLKTISESSAGRAISLGVTVLTSLSDEDLAAMGYKNKSPEQVSLFAGLAKQAGLSGVVCSAQEAKMLREQLGPDAYIVTPGIRPENMENDDQSRVTTPKMAFLEGSSHIVVGRPITEAKDPLKAFLDIIKHD